MPTDTMPNSAIWRRTLIRLKGLRKAGDISAATTHMTISTQIRPEVLSVRQAARGFPRSEPAMRSGSWLSLRPVHGRIAHAASRVLPAPTAAAIRVSSVASARSKRPAMRPSRMTMMRSLRPEDFGQLRRHHDDGGALDVGEVGEKLIDLPLGADIDAARRLIEQQDGAAGVEAAGDHAFLLIAAGERFDPGAGGRACGCRGGGRAGRRSSRSRLALRSAVPAHLASARKW